MIQYEFRNYLPAIGRWMTRDPLGEAGGLNLYAFVGNNPVNWVDPWGLYRSPEWARRWLPWVPAWDLALTNFEQGNYLAGVGNTATSFVTAALVAAPIATSPAVQEMACSVRLGAGVAEAAQIGNMDSHSPIAPEIALSQATKWLGNGYREIAPGVFRSLDGLRQFRMTISDITGAHGGVAHVNFETLNAAGKVTENLHLPILP